VSASTKPPGQAPACDRGVQCGWMRAPQSPCLRREDADFHEQTAMEAVISFLQTYGRPRQIPFDRDPRWVGGSAGRDFPSPLRRLLLCLGIDPHICPPHRPDKNAYVERYHRTYRQECIQRYQPTTLQEVTRPSPRRFSSITTGSVLDPRPDLWQCPAACGLSDLANLTSPRHLRVDPDGWLTSLNRKMYLRHVGRDGRVDLDLATYSIGPKPGWTYGPVPGARREPPICRLASGPARQAASDQRPGRAGDGPARLSEVYPSLKRWLLRGVPLPMGEDKVRQPPLWGEGT